ncbi:MAG: FitA-like ribbon-helix-helix domain-containing protein [Solirubrobacterales bacterium]
MQIRDVPDDVHRTLKARAAEAGMPLSAYLRETLAQLAARPTPGELSARIELRGPAELGEGSADAVRRLRDQGE